ncbi:MAG: ABC transporter transmembrane domain-containing protein [Gammaproteobacteria bacterium]|nr:ABC transporter transmembrane domain-containing protein [Gammaproteobacteria bacterium]
MDDYPDREASKNLGSLKPVFEFLAPYKWQVAVASAALIVTASVTLSVGQGIRLILDEGFALGSPEVLMTSIAVFAALVVLLAAGTFTRFYYVSWVGERISADIRRAVYDHLIHMHPGFFQFNQPTEIQSRITTDTTLLQTVIGSSVSIALRNVIMFVGGLVLLFVTNVKLSLLVVICAPIVVLPIIVFGRRVRRLSRTSQDTLADVGSYAGESLRHIKIVQAFNHQAHDVEAFADRVNIAFLVAVRRIRQRAWLIALVMILVLAAIATMLWVGGQDVLAGTISGGELAAFIFYAFIVAGSVGAISEVWTDLQRAAGATERLIELLNAVSDLEEPARPVVLRAPGSVEFKAVSFAYPARPEVQVLNEVSFKIEPGEMVALVGPSGAGKSTMFDLMQRFYDPSAGEVLVAGVPARDLALDALRESIGVVPQDPTLFAGTLRDNLTYGDPDADEASCEDALRAAHALEFIEALPEGLTTRVGEDGQGLSGGQRQRLAIARAMLVRPSILLMDEVTSALDAHSEDAIRETLAGLKGKCTVVIIAHRLSTVVQADRILVLDGGRIVGAGTHQELLSSNVLYKEFAEIQLTNVVLAAR